MPKQSLSSTDLDRVFQALADPTRRAVLERLGEGPAAMSELAQPFAMALPSFAQHLGVLEGCGLVQSQKQGRVRTYALVPKAYTAAQTWMDTQRRLWEGRLDRMDAYVLQMKRQEKK